MTPSTTPFGESPLGSCHQGGTFESSVRYGNDKSNKKPLSGLTAEATKSKGAVLLNILINQAHWLNTYLGMKIY